MDKTVDITLNSADEYAEKFIRMLLDAAHPDAMFYDALRDTLKAFYIQAVQICNASASVLGQFDPPVCSPGGSAKAMLRGELEKMSGLLKTEQLKYSPPIT